MGVLWFILFCFTDCVNSKYQTLTYNHILKNSVLVHLSASKVMEKMAISTVVRWISILDLFFLQSKYEKGQPTLISKMFKCVDLSLQGIIIINSAMDNGHSVTFQWQYNVENYIEILEEHMLPSIWHIFQGCPWFSTYRQCETEFCTC